MRRCPACGRYTLKRECGECGEDTAGAHPARYSPDDKYARYRLAERYAEAGGQGPGEEAGPGPAAGEEAKEGAAGAPAVPGA